MTDDAPDITDDQQEFLSHHPASKATLADRLGVKPTTIEGYQDRLERKGFKFEYDRDENEWRIVTDPRPDHGSASGSEESDSEESLPTTDPEDSLDGNAIPQTIINALEDDGLTYRQFEERHGYSESQAKRLLEDMREAGYPVEFREIDAQGTRLWYLSDQRDTSYRVGAGDGIYRFGLISDTHLGSKEEHLDELNDFYDRLVERGITTVYHAGDISDGYKVYRGHVNGLRSPAIGWGRLRDYVVENYPSRPSITTYFITGNHDYKYYKRNGIHFGQLIDDQREDLNWLGEMQATLVFDAAAGIDLELIHPSGGKPYTLGYRAQTLYRERPPTDRPTLAGIGHLHGKMQAEAEGVEAFYTGCWQGATPYIKRKGFPTKIGGWIVELEIEDDHLRRLNTEWVDYHPRGAENSYHVDDLAALDG
jgi:hypothetical protein